jgi:protein involved in polysaccharide export with SLBB domain
MIVLLSMILKFEHTCWSDNNTLVSSEIVYPEDNITLEAPIIPKKYIIGPGDELIIRIWGRVNITHHFKVTPEGKLIVPPTGTLDVKGLTLKETEEKIKQILYKYHQNVNIDVVLHKLRMFKVFVLGEVNSPGVYSARAVDRVSQLITQAGGVTSKGSLREIEVFIKGKKIATVDMLSFMRYGDLSTNIYVSSGMVIFVPQKKCCVTLKGEINSPGKYEIRSGETLKDIIELAGGLTSYAMKKHVTITRIINETQKSIIRVDLTTKDIHHTLKDGDVIYVPSIDIFQNVVFVKGAVYGVYNHDNNNSHINYSSSYGVYPLRKHETLYDIIIKTGGVMPVADLKHAYIERYTEEGIKKNIPVDLYALVVEKDKTKDIELTNGDTIVIPFIEDKVYCIGSVNNPGAISYEPNRNVFEYIGLAGGYTTRSKVNKVTIIRKDGKIITTGKKDVIIEPGDIIIVPEKRLKWWQDYLTIISTLISGIIAISTISE